MLESMSNPGPVFGVQGPDIEWTTAQHIKAALESGPTQGRKSYSEASRLTNHPPQLLGFRTEHSLVRQTHEKRPGDGIPKCIASLEDPPPTQLKEARQHASRKLRVC